MNVSALVLSQTSSDDYKRQEYTYQILIAGILSTVVAYVAKFLVFGYRCILPLSCGTVRCSAVAIDF